MLTKLSACLVALCAALLTCISTLKAEQDFVHLLEAANINRRLHIRSEIVQNGYRVDAEEFLDLETLNQLVQIKWFDAAPISNASSDQSSELMKMRKLNIVVLNSEQKSFIYRYEPFACTLNELTPANGDIDWQRLKKRSNLSDDPNQFYKDLIESLLSTARNSPHLTRLEANNTNGFRLKHDSWLMGVSGLWAKAQFGGSPLKRAGSSSGAWRIESQGLLIDYFVDSFMLANDLKQEDSGPKSSHDEADFEEYDALSLIEIKDASDEHTIQLINVFQVDYNFTQSLAKNLFKLPIGFNCPPNPLLDKSQVFLRGQGSQLIQLEIVANKYAGLHSESLFAQTDIKNVEISRLKHPIDQSSSLQMFHSREDRFKVVSDYYYLLDYRVDFDGPKHGCTTKRLNYGQALHFDNDILLDLSQFHLNYLLNLEQDPMESGLVTDEMHLLNVFEPSEDKNEFIFESEVPKEHKEMLKLTDSSGHYVDRQMTIVRVYEQQIARAKGAPSNGRRSARAFLGLKRVLILVLDAERNRKLAEVRLNLIDEIEQMISYSKRANLFDLSACFDKREQTMELVVTYAADPNLLEFAQEHGPELVDRFYQSASDWRAPGDVSTLDSGMLEKERLGLSLNFLRMPRVELRPAPGGDLELRVTLLDKVSPLQAFKRVENSTFVSLDASRHNEQDNKKQESEDITSMLLESVEECARFCQLYECKVFAYNLKSQCRLTHLPVLKGSLSKADETEIDETTRGVKLTLESASELYFEPEWLRYKRFKEANLAQLSSYLEHFASELASYSSHPTGQNEAGDDAEDQDPNTNIRTRRAASVKALDQPLFSFDFVDRSGLQSDYAPPGIRMLIPSELSITHLPLVLDVSESSQLARVGKSFRVTMRGSMYHFGALDASRDEHSSLEDAEATFLDEHNRRYYTLKKVTGIDEDNCALLCFNIDEWNARSNGQQQCVSFSYTRASELCVLAVQTDFDFVKDVSELVEAGRELAPVDSLEKLLVSQYDAVLAMRNYLQEYEGPIVLAGGLHGYATTDGLDFGFEIEWLQARVIESSEPHEEERESCAAKCATRNKLAKHTCLAFDFCATKSKASPNVAPRYQTLCDLLLVSGSDGNQDRQKIANLREHLSQKTNASAQAEKQPQINARNRLVLSHSCNRYLLSHLRDFTHLNQRQLLAESTANKLKIIDEPSSNANLDRCALECSMRGAQCLLFEFCMSINSQTEQKLTRSCTMYKSASSSLSEARQAGDGSEANPAAKELTSYNRDCHIYLRKQFSSIEEAIEYQEGGASGYCRHDFEHVRLAGWFLVAYLVMVAGFAVYFAREYNLALRERLGNLVRGVNERYLARA